MNNSQDVVKIVIDKIKNKKDKKTVPLNKVFQGNIKGKFKIPGADTDDLLDKKGAHKHKVYQEIFKN